MINHELTKELEALLESMKAKKVTVATAESCTGGLLATWLTDLAGSSAAYVGGVSAYANRAKVRLLGVSEILLAQHGAVSASVAEAMAAGVQQQLGSTFALALTGVAGPDGGTTAKPVGTVFCGIATPRGLRSVEMHLSGDRISIREQAARRALQELSYEITH